MSQHKISVKHLKRRFVEIYVNDALVFANLYFNRSFSISLNENERELNAFRLLLTAIIFIFIIIIIISSCRSRLFLIQLFAFDSFVSLNESAQGIELLGEFREVQCFFTHAFASFVVLFLNRRTFFIRYTFTNLFFLVRRFLSFGSFFFRNRSICFKWRSSEIAEHRGVSKLSRNTVPRDYLFVILFAPRDDIDS